MVTRNNESDIVKVHDTTAPGWLGAYKQSLTSSVARKAKIVKQEADSLARKAEIVKMEAELVKIKGINATLKGELQEMKSILLYSSSYC